MKKISSLTSHTLFNDSVQASMRVKRLTVLFAESISLLRDVESFKPQTHHLRDTFNLRQTVD